MAEDQMPEEQEKRLPFDEEIAARFKDTIHRCLTDFPELRSVIVAFDWAGNLNDAPIKAGVWQGERGGVDSAAGIVGSIQQTIKVMEQQFLRLHKLEQAMREELTVIGQELVRKKEELARLSEGSKNPDAEA